MSDTKFTPRVFSGIQPSGGLTLGNYLGAIKRFVSMQDHLNLLYREEEREMLPLCREEKIAVTPYSPMASGRLTRDWSETSKRMETDNVARSKYDATADKDRIIVERLAQIAADRGVSRVEIALAWLLQKEPVVVPIIGATIDKNPSGRMKSSDSDAGIAAPTSAPTSVVAYQAGAIASDTPAKYLTRSCRDMFG